MQQRKIVRALCLAMGMGFAAGAFAAGDQARVIVQFKAGAKEHARGALRGAGAAFHHELDAVGAFAVTVPAQAIEGLRRNPNIAFVEEDAPRFAMAQSVPYGIDLVQARDVWDKDRNGAVDAGAPTGAGVTVCVIDSGARTAHEDLQGVNFLGGYPASWTDDTCGHGSHVTGTIAAANNSSGVVGVSPGAVNIFAVQVFSGADCGWSYSSTLIDAATRCKNAGAKIISMSLGGTGSSTTERTAFENLNAQGILSIAAAGNAGTTAMSYPASYSSVMSVGAVDSAKAKASFSQYNAEVDIAAPGVAVLSTVPFISASTTVGTASYLVTAIENSPASTASAPVVNGGLCTSAGAWVGKVVLCERGTIAFGDKVNNVQAGGGVAAIIYNNVAGGLSATMPAGAGIPAVTMSQADGQDIVANRLNQTAVVNTISGPGSGYEAWDGTSMATPHVSGVAAVLWSANPSWTNTQIRNAMQATAEDLGAAGRDNNFGYGLVRTAAALAYLQGGGNPPPAGAPSNLSATGGYSKGKFNVTLGWTGGGSTVDVWRDGAKVKSAIANSGSYAETLRTRGSGTIVYKVCNAGSATACTSNASVNF